ncbi:hypothetical protein SAMN05444279_11041 [Ruegeria intermedia]|uniref:DUF1178 family protein n=1 Tax=Ruegeria intermedia TaxID=996115 RepID=A0A1M4WZ44_9RHOB|nr:DUF1178 family protein [Ruegeria intermedia]SHE86519.1 hypothetical protein SAMN05444279_11041 [Ruegeria intermedia]
MIQYALKCSNGHGFDSWFQSADAYDKLAKAGMVTCTQCGCTSVEKAVMTPRLSSARSTQAPAPRAEAAPSKAEIERVLKELRAKVEANSDYVGRDFAREARKIHLGEAPERPIYGEARAEEAKALIEDGVPVAPLPFVPSRKTN